MFDEIYFQTQEDFPMSLVLGFSVGPFQLSDHVVQNRQTWEQMTQLGTVEAWTKSRLGRMTMSLYRTFEVACERTMATNRKTT